MNLALVVAASLVGGLFLERSLLTRWRHNAYFTLGFPLIPALVPIPDPPTGAGATASVQWEVVDKELVRFWSKPGDRSSPMGLHGAIHLTRAGRGVQLDVRWSPPLTPLAAATWLAALGSARGEAALMLPLAAAMIIGMILLYRSAAIRAAAELRWAWVRGEGPPVG